MHPRTEQSKVDLKLEKKVIALLGAGRIGGALAQAISSAAPASEVIATDISDERIEEMRSIGVRGIKNNIEAVKAADIVLLAVKPKEIRGLLSEVSGTVGKQHLVISIAAGVPIGFIEQRLPKARVIRAMPNIAVMVHEAITALAPGKSASTEDMEMAKALFSSVGKCVVVEESAMDAVTGLSGSGPGFVFTMIEALADGGVKAGLPHDLALLLAAQTMLGSAKMVLETGQHPAQLRNSVATPAGTTIEGLLIIEESGVRATLIKAVDAATRRTKEISEQLFS